ncbi:hypothetical protein [Vibrio splendidus]|uniref:hypothetical protein n=1 Tax=Vibrio splendidus TaxID=29497 RepID=UPI0002F2D1D1|nr:hypothetical protein [Vibrio splendidus]OED83657.1 hypothetical protein A144_15960 [Vibrio splendidus ZF-90]PTP33742.1 hypothetical protein CWN95_15610 [Vibrio splendidus]
MGIEQKITDLQKTSAEQTAASQALSQEVAGKMGEIDKNVKESKAKVDGYLASARSENAIYRQSRNQSGMLTDGNLDFFSKNSKFAINVSLYRTISSGIEWNARDSEEQEILTSMGMKNYKHFQPQIRVMKLEWDGFLPSDHSSHSIYPNPIGNGSGTLTIGSYAKLISGSIRGWWLNGINSEWGICGQNSQGKPGRYIHAYPYVQSAAGEVLFIWPGIVSGHITIDRASPQWGFWPCIYEDSSYGAKVGG